MSEIRNRLGEIRRQRGVSASDLAETVEVSRQTIYAIEAGTYVPNTAVALRLARALGVEMERLFSLAKENGRHQKAKGAILIPSGQSLQPGQAVQICEVNGKLVATAPTPANWYLQSTDATIVEGDHGRGTAQVQLKQPEGRFDNRVLLAGCDPAMAMVARHLQSAGIEMILVHQNSSQSLSLLKAGLAHVAGCHLRDDTSEDSNVGVVNTLFPSRSAILVSFAIWQEGLVTASGNPKQIKGVQDLARRQIMFINRENGSGSRSLLDRHLRLLNMDSKRVRGYSKIAPGHLPAAWEVKSGRADCCLSIEASARFFGLHFIPLETVRYDLVVRKQQLATPAIQILLDAISHLSLRRKLQGFGGYDTSVTGSRVQ